MTQAYWIITFRLTTDQAGIDRYAAAAGPAIRAHGGRVLAAGLPAGTFENGLAQRAAVVAFDSVALATEAYVSADYQDAVAHLAGAAERDVRVVEGLS